MYKVFKIVKETSGLVIIRMKTSCPIGHSVFILIITKPSVFNYHQQDDEVEKLPRIHVVVCDGKEYIRTDFLQ